MKMPTLGACHCRQGIERDNCPNCEGTGQAIDWAAFHGQRFNVRRDAPAKAPTGFADRVMQRLTAEQKKPEARRV